MTIVEAISSFSGTNMQVGIQNIAPDSQGPWTGENSPLMASEVGCKYAEIGHAERRNYFHENEDLIIQKIKVSLKNQLTPIICIGEKEKMAPKEAERFAIQEVESILSSLHEDAFSNELIFAWEPQWAIGAPGYQPRLTIYKKFVWLFVLNLANTIKIIVLYMAGVQGKIFYLNFTLCRWIVFRTVCT